MGDHKFDITREQLADLYERCESARDWSRELKEQCIELRGRSGKRRAELRATGEAVGQLFSSRQYAYCLIATSMLVDTLLEAGTSNHRSEAETAIDGLGAAVEEHQPIRDITVLRLRTLRAKARNDGAAYRDLRDRYRAMANSLGYEGHMAWAEALP